LQEESKLQESGSDEKITTFLNFTFQFSFVDLNNVLNITFSFSL